MSPTFFGIAQLNPVIGDLLGNCDRILTAVQKLAKQGVQLVLTPELSICGYPPRDLLMNHQFVRDMEIAISELASKLPPDIAVLVGTVSVNPQANQSGGKPLFNSAALLQDGRVQQVFRKRLLPTYDVFDEDRYFAVGNGSNVFTLNLKGGASLNIGVTICEDIWNDEKFWGKRNYADDPVAELATNHELDLLLNLSASPYAVGKQKLRESMLSHSAIMHNLPLLYANQVGANDDLIFDGRSMAFDRHGKIITRGKSFEEDLLVINLDEVSLDSSRYESDDAEIFAALVLGVRDYVQKCRFRQVVIGLSGGIDSALVAAIAAEAIGKENVLGVLMPSPYSSAHSITDAIALAHNLGISTQTIPIQPMMEAFDASLANLFVGQTSDVTEENLQSRIRGSLLMAISNKFGHLLLSTGNKSEISVGYCTLYGDMNGGLAAIADVPKTRVFSICKWLNRTSSLLMIKQENSEVIPVNIITKPPSAELKPDQLDQDSLPPYDILDDILHKLINQHLAAAEISATGHDPAIVDRVVRLVKIAEFKRRQAAPGLKITNRAFGSGWRMPIASKVT
ncbi:MAG: NAD+ synthase [Pseudanabaena sp. M135S2SP2A07QC]|nr:NAD+ synthase [Pseudanabaena sp. M090S1SP2A07QC]MCA6505768.1 NAD+ synthase [Pseudanabaena sp. M172S2SP2A07QC]MCA6521888.1 NAD+ synthase [Pseudanabaena sp. M051S1SP2A07QC]MCA6524531.1 NAD+ synthase [Pseudanabaena sp. M179S2SP2A07QC]MCA6528535.1 NAD+ synthase [Pseudanabaena sp. M125S2SP2A07QC]MCA6534472.1 NAD+ synthase [Pseudanabaena sp. M176S2SP2A07QC]MCA6539290.1 NAD+ synthase [Pseudanabaena sp. M037S2SP2A07QC]MCA6544057.1 NAD+ synthase [Pseudanabaena sp. M074S1SP2A07QC]MCA6547971.1 NAD+